MQLNAPVMPLGKVGVWAWGLTTLPAEEVREAARAIEGMGYGALWFPESTGREVFTTSSLLLEATKRIVVATGIANLWARDPLAMAAGARALGEAHPGRLVLGIGVSHAPSVARRGHEYHQPLETVRRYLDGMASAGYHGPEPTVGVPVILAALGPKMLDLAAERTAGAHPYFVPLEHTSFARNRLGAGPFLAPEQAVVVSSDPDEARTLARAHTRGYLALDNYANNLRRMGWVDADLADGGSDDLVDAVVAWGDLDAIAERVQRHLGAGADHVSIQVISDQRGIPLAELEALSAHLLG